jgi:hypothetical protein
MSADSVFIATTLAAASLATAAQGAAALATTNFDHCFHAFRYYAFARIAVAQATALASAVRAAAALASAPLDAAALVTTPFAVPTLVVSLIPLCWLPFSPRLPRR